MLLQQYYKYLGPLLVPRALCSGPDYVEEGPVAGTGLDQALDLEAILLVGQLYGPVGLLQAEFGLCTASQTYTYTV